MIRSALRPVRALSVAALLAAVATAARAQQPVPKPVTKKPTTGQTVEIRGQAPTPQVVTVRPREVPAYQPSGLPQAVMTSGTWPSISAGYAVTPPSQLSGRLPVDTTAAGLARGGAPVGAVGVAAGAAAAGAAAGGAPAAGGAAAPVVGASATEIEAMRRELVERKARLDSLEHAMSQNAAQQKAAAAPAGPAAAARMSASDSAARAAEIEAIRQELRYRKARLDSLQQEVNSLGKQSKQQKKKAVKPDTSPSKPSGNPPRGLR